MLKVRIQETLTDYAVMLDGDVEYILTASQGLIDCIPPDRVQAVDGLLHVDVQAAHFFEAWLEAVRHTHRAKIVWIPITANA